MWHHGPDGHVRHARSAVTVRRRPIRHLLCNRFHSVGQVYRADHDVRSLVPAPAITSTSLSIATLATVVSVVFVGDAKMNTRSQRVNGQVVLRGYAFMVAAGTVERLSRGAPGCGCRQLLPSTGRSRRFDGADELSRGDRPRVGSFRRLWPPLRC